MKNNMIRYRRSEKQKVFYLVVSPSVFPYLKMKEKKKKISTI